MPARGCIRPYRKTSASKIPETRNLITPNRLFSALCEALKSLSYTEALPFFRSAFPHCFPLHSQYMDTPISASALIRRSARLAFHLHDDWFETLPDIRQIRRLTQQLNAQNPDSPPLNASDLNAFWLIANSLFGILNWYEKRGENHDLGAAKQFLFETLGAADAQSALIRFETEFPSQPVFEGSVSAQDFVAAHGIPVLKQLVIERLLNENPALKPFKVLMDDAGLMAETPYLAAWTSLQSYMTTSAPAVSVEETALEANQSESLWDLLTASARLYPDSLTAQLTFLRGRWTKALADVFPDFEVALLRAEDYIREETKPVFPPSFDPPPLPPMEELQMQMRQIIEEAPEPEAFSEDLDWMPNVVMIAKATLVWLYQLSQQYGREITHLDQIPDEELALLKHRGINSLWFIGIWERSRASERFKKTMGNPEATASAYSLHDYEIAQNLGGRGAFLRLKERAWRYGIRIASDMVPNHTGLDADWVLHHPDRFIQSSEPPYPSYTFTRENISDDPHIGIYMEDHYYNHSDASVVFKRVDHRTGEARYIYHGNDGTGIPWNDTAQINFLNPEAKEAVIQTILRVAHDFPIIRLDAAMVLAKRHIHRLWFPEPGKGGDIASRAEFGLTKEAFDVAMPEEFWREVVDRVAVEAPDTLLLAEAFWMLEGYFVRTLGMHRVYNSAFMHMLRDERNAEFRHLITSTLEYDPEILKRYVNFLNNPDEKTAVEQFGRGDKYFGVTLLMLTLPGLPMFGHGQIEGFSEKYGMEYRRSYYDEKPDEHLRARHDREVFPIARKRYLFGEVTDFRFYDFVQEGIVNENVMVFTNRMGKERAVVLYNNAFQRAEGAARLSVKFRNKNKEKSDGEPVLETQSIAEALGLRKNGKWFTIFTDERTGLEYLCSNKDVWSRGIRFGLDGYQARIFTQIHEVEDSIGLYQELYDSLKGHGVHSVEDEIKQRQLRSLHEPFVGVLSALYDRINQPNEDAEGFAQRYEVFLREAVLRTGNGVDYAGLMEHAKRLVTRVMHIEQEAETVKISLERWQNPKFRQAVMVGWLSVADLGRITSRNGKYVGIKSRGFIEAWLLDGPMERVFSEHGLSREDARQAIVYIVVLTALRGWFHPEKDVDLQMTDVLTDIFNDPVAQHYMNVHLWEGQRWFHKERFEELLILVGFLALREHETDGIEVASMIHDVTDSLREMAAQVSYNLDQLLELITAPDAEVPATETATEDDTEEDTSADQPQTRKHHGLQI